MSPTIPSSQCQPYHMQFKDWVGVLQLLKQQVDMYACAIRNEEVMMAQCPKFDALEFVFLLQET